MSDAPAARIPLQPWMAAAETRAVLAALGGGGRFVGGCVRDALLGRAVGDIDIATPLTPEEVTRRLTASAIKVVPTGLAHGTVTAVVAGRPFEITTLRRDVETDGRHARVAFTDDWVEDARRRDFTMNALFLDADGAIFDPVGGLSDLHAGRVRFVGDPTTRIREDVLRILRFYRFHAHYGAGEPDPAGRAACRTLAHLLPNLSRERVATELLKLLAAPDPTPVLRLMEEDGVLAAILPEARQLGRLAALIPLEPTPDSIRRLAALTDGGAEAIAERLRLSTADRERLAILAKLRAPIDLAGDEPVQHQALYRLGADRYRDLVLLRAAERGDADRARTLLALADRWPVPKFPLRGADVTKAGVPAGPAVGRLLNEIEAWWRDGDFRADRAACLTELRRRLARE
ncbi:MAG TPA: CCA tRNA nucleotidyltransferase [Stellaceae bacterium]|nr:CCA tRNA nucleotidyltransferase [Stellaceae bacterium]